MSYNMNIMRTVFYGAVRRGDDDYLYYTKREFGAIDADRDENGIDTVPMASLRYEVLHMPHCTTIDAWFRKRFASKEQPEEGCGWGAEISAFTVTDLLADCESVLRELDGMEIPLRDNLTERLSANDPRGFLERSGEKLGHAWFGGSGPLPHEQGLILAKRFPVPWGYVFSMGDIRAVCRTVLMLRKGLDEDKKNPAFRWRYYVD